MSWLLNILYAGLLVLCTPWLIYRRVVLKKDRGGWREKLWGDLERQHPQKPCIWLHAVSVGEVLQLKTVLQELTALYPGYEYLITTTTATGRAVAEKQYPQHTVRFCPLDFSWAVKRALRQIRPALLVFVELELWPNLIRAATRKQIPLALINGRLSEKSFRGYRWIRPLIAHLLQQFRVVAVQNAEYAKRFRALGTPDDVLTITGTLKFDRLETNRANPKTQGLRAAFGILPDQPVFLAGSTQAPEEELAIPAWVKVRQELTHLRLLLVPRHQERFEEVAHLVTNRFELPLIRRSELLEAKSPVEPEAGAVCLLDTLGELTACWGLAEIAFVGGSLTKRGGQNMIEPAAYGAAVLFGPNTWNFQDVTDALLSHHAARQVHDAGDLTNVVRELLRDPRAARQMGAAAQRFVLTQHGATQRTIERLQSLLTESSSTITRAA